MSQLLLDDGMVLRRPLPREIDQVCELLASRGDPEDADDLRLVIDHQDEGLDSCRVVVSPDGKVVSTATLLKERIRVGSVVVSAGQVELVATDPGFERRGLVRALMDDAHRRSAERGDALQVVIGIPYFYRRFGYEYAMPIPLLRDVDATTVGSHAQSTVREATESDLATLAALNEATQSAASIAMNHSDACWSWMVNREASSVWVVESGGDIEASARAVVSSDEVILAEIAGSNGGVESILAHARAQFGGSVQAVERPNATVAHAVEQFLDPVDDRGSKQDWYYARAGDLAGLLQILSPELQRRWSEAGRSDTAKVLISLWGSHVTFEMGPGGVADVRTGGPEQAPISKGGSGIAPDAVPALILGPAGALGIEKERPDCYLGRQREVLEILFPPQSADLMTFYLPV